MSNIKLLKLEMKIESLELILNSKDKEIERLIAQVDRLQDALTATTAPIAYNDRRADQSDSTVDPEEVKRHKKQANINAELLYRMEAPTFVDADDMIGMLTGVTADEFMSSKSTHDNGES